MPNLDMRNRWERFLDSLDTAGGHLVILFVLMVGGVFMLLGGVQKGEDVLIGAFGALLGALKAVRSVYTRNQEGAAGSAQPVGKEGE